MPPRGAGGWGARSLGRAGWWFGATPEEVEELDLERGPKDLVVRRKGRRRPLVSEASHRSLESPAVIEALLGGMPTSGLPRLEIAGSTRDVSLFRLPSGATEWLASFPGGEPEEFYEDLDLPVKACIGTQATMGLEFGGLVAIVLRMRGAALEAASLADGRVYYWWWSDEVAQGSLP